MLYRKRCGEWVRVVQKRLDSYIFYLHHCGDAPTSGVAAALARNLFADPALGALHTAHGAAGTAAFLAGGASAFFAFEGTCSGAGFICGPGVVGVHGEWRQQLEIKERLVLEF